MKFLRCLIALATFPVLDPLVAARTEIPNAAQPQLVAGSNGRVWLVYARALAVPATTTAEHGHGHGNVGAGKKKAGHGPTGRAGEVFVASSTDGGATFSTPVKIAHVPQLMLGNRRGPRIAAHGDQLTVTVIADELIAFTSSDGGRTWSDRVAINEVPGSAREGLHDLAGSPEGYVYVTWLDLRGGATELWGSGSKDGGSTWSKNEQIYKSSGKSICECCHPNALFDAQGNLAIMWRNSIDGARDMWMATRAKGTRPFSAARKLGEGTWKLNACPMDGGKIIPLGGGKFGAVWQRAGEVFLVQDHGPEVSIGKGRQPVALTGGQGTAVIWQEGTDLVAIRGSRGGPKKLAADARFPAAVALAGDNGAVVAYEVGEKGKSSIVIQTF